METTTENRKRRGYVKKRVKTVRSTEQPGDWHDWGTFDIIVDVAEIFEEERNSLEDVLFDEEDNFVEEEFDDDKFFVALRLSPRPEQLVKGYEFQMLNKWELFECWDCE